MAYYWGRWAPIEKNYPSAKRATTSLTLSIGQRLGVRFTYITRGRGHQRAAAIVPAELVEHYEAILDREDGEIAMQRLADLDAGRVTAISAVRWPGPSGCE